jgi:predicted transcriptional regulator of viral defense system
MRSIDALAALGTLGKPVITTAEASATWRMDLPSASKALSRLAASNLVQNVRQGIWAIGRDASDLFEVAPVLTRPYPNYVSMYSALFRHGMIDQIPSTIDLMSLGRPMKLETSVGFFTVHHLHEDSFDGFVGQSAIRSGLATAEKALVDTVTVLGVRGGVVTLPEIDLPVDFDLQTMWAWVEKVSSRRLRTIVTRNLKRMIEPALANLTHVHSM